MRCWAVLSLVLVACDASAPPVAPPPPSWVYRPATGAWPLGVRLGQIGRGQAPQLAPVQGIVGDGQAPLHLPTPWAVPGDGAARAVIYGQDGDHAAIELIDIDAGRLLWRDPDVCAGPVVGVTSEAIVCADAGGTRGVSIDRKTTWRSEMPFIAMTGDQVVVGPTGLAVILDATTGDELSRVTLPAGVLAESILASCGDVGRELFATGMDGRLVRIADATGGPAIQWSVEIGTIDDLDACEGEVVRVRTVGAGGAALVALARATGAATGRVDGVRGVWRARTGDGIEISTASGVDAWTADLTASRTLELPPLGELLSARGDRRLVRATPRTAVVLDPGGVRAYVPLSAMGAVLGDRALVGASWVGSAGETVRRHDVPGRYRRTLRLLHRRAGLAVPAALRDLPPPVALELGAAVAAVDQASGRAVELVVDPYDDQAVLAILAERGPGTATAAATVTRLDVGQPAWTWLRPGGCAPGEPIGLAVARAVVVCAARGPSGDAQLVATYRGGQPAWTWSAAAVDRVQAAGATVLAHAADRAFVLDAATGKVHASLSSDDGSAVRAALIELADQTTVVVAFERGRLVARLPAVGMIAAWSVEVLGVVEAIAPAADGVLVELEDGDAYWVDVRTGQAAGLAGVGLEWRAGAELIAGTTAGGDIPGVAPPEAPPVRPLVRRTAAGRRLLVPPELEDRPKLWTPIPPPPPLGVSFQLSLYDHDGSLRARNDYPVIGDRRLAASRGPAGSPLLLRTGASDVLVLDPATGDPVRRVTLPLDVDAAVFSTMVDGRPIAGAVLARPVRLVLF